MIFLAYIIGYLLIGAAIATLVKLTSKVETDGREDDIWAVIAFVYLAWPIVLVILLLVLIISPVFIISKIKGPDAKKVSDKQEK